jgi:predicted anti-sigma-YlaC factor YlaD
MKVDELTCRELVEIVTDYLEGAMELEERIRFEKHLVLCDGCAIYVEQMRDVISLTGSLREEHVPENAREALLDAFRSWRNP